MAARTDFERHLKSENALAVYALVGPDSVLVGEAVALLRAKAVTEALDFNRDEFQAGETPIERVLDAAATLPMMAPARWVHLGSIERLRANELERLVAYIDKPSPTSVLCLSGDKLDLRTSLARKLSEGGGLFAFEPPRQKDLASWLVKRAAKRGARIGLDGARLLTDLVGSDIGALDMAVDKAAAYAGEQTEISAEHVEATVAPVRLHRIFDLTDAIGNRDLATASMLLRNALGGGETALMVLGMIARHVRQLLSVKALLAQGVSRSALATELGIPPFLAEPLSRQAGRYGSPELYAALGAVASADLRLKSSRVDPGVVLDRLLIEIVTTGADRGGHSADVPNKQRRP